MNVFKIFECNQLAIKQTAAYRHNLTTALQTGSYITIVGTIEAQCLRFSIDLVGEDATGNIALHFNPRLEQRYVVRNARINGTWGDEDTCSVVRFDLEPLKKFTVNILVADDEFKVAVNGRNFCSFRFRLPLKAVSAVEVRGRVDCETVEVTEIASYPVATPGAYHEIAFDENFDATTATNFDAPYTGILPKGFQRGWQLEVYGQVKLLPHSFYVNLQDSAQLWPHPLIPLHLNPRFSSAIGANSFVRNSWTPLGWSHEERAPSFPFIPGYPFCLIIRMEDDGYSVWVDEKLTGEYRYNPQIADRIVSCVHIHGDVHVKHVTMRSTISDAYLLHKQNVVIDKL